MLKKIAFTAVGLSLLVSPLIASAQVTLPPDCSSNPTVTCLQQEIQLLIQILTQLLALRGHNPNPAFSATPTYGQAPLQVMFAVQGNLSFDISFGDGYGAGPCSVGQCNLNHIYTTPGTYTAAIYKPNSCAYPPPGSPLQCQGNPIGTTMITVGSSTPQTATLTVSTDVSSPSYQVVAGGSTGVVLGVFKYHASGEGINLTKVGLALNSGKTGDLNQVYLYNNTGTLLGTMVFTGTNLTVISTLSTPLNIPRDNDANIIVKGDIGSIGIGGSATPGDLVQLSPNTSTTQGTGASSGTIVALSGNTGTIDVAGVRIFKSYPIVSLISLPTDGLADGRLMRFSITASPQGTIGLAQIQVSVSGLAQNTNAQVDLHAYTDSTYQSPVSYCTSSDCHDASAINGLAINNAAPGGILTFPKPLEIPAGTTYYFELRDSTKGTGVVNGAAALTTTLGGASSFAGMGTIPALTGAQYVLWSPNDFTTSAFSDSDWTNGYGVTALLVNGISQTRTGSGTIVSHPQPPSSVPVRIYLTSGSSWTVPSNWNNANNSIEVIGAGGGGGGNGRRGGGGGAYSKSTNVALTAGASVAINVGAAGTGTGANGGDTYFNGTNCAGSSACAKGGQGGADHAGGQGGAVSGGVGSIKYGGGSAGDNVDGLADGSGGGGAAGPHGYGVSSGDASTGKCDVPGSGGSSGGIGDDNAGGYGGRFSYFGESQAQSGGNGTEFDASHGSGGGGGGGSDDCSTTVNGGTGGNYGGGGGGGGRGGYGIGGNGLIVITYTPATTASASDANINLANALTALESLLQKLLGALGK
jgi:hypothetical protein